MQLLIILLLVLLNGVLAMSEIAVVSARRGRLQQESEEGRRGSAVALELSNDPNRFLSTVQIGITLVGIIAGAFGGTTLGRQLGEWLAANAPITTQYSEPLGIALVVLLTTYLSLVLGELVPKRLGMQFPNAIASRIAVPMRNLSVVAAPIVWLLSLSTDTMLRLLGIDPNAEPTLSDTEVVNMVREGTQDGVFAEGEVEMVRGVLGLDETPAMSIMTPRPDIHLLRLEDDFDKVQKTVISTPHSFYPVCNDGEDNVVGIIKAKDLLKPLLAGETVDLKRVIRPPLFIPGATTASRALELFKASGAQMALVVGEHGGIEGLLTLNDIIEEIFGDVDADEPEAVQREDGSWLLDGRMPLTRFEDILPDQTHLNEEDMGGYRTLAGFVMAQLDRMPRIGDHFIYAEYRFEVVDMDAARVDRVLVEPKPTAPKAEKPDTSTEA